MPGGGAGRGRQVDPPGPEERSIIQTTGDPGSGEHPYPTAQEDHGCQVGIYDHEPDKDRERAVPRDKADEDESKFRIEYAEVIRTVNFGKLAEKIVSGAKKFVTPRPAPSMGRSVSRHQTGAVQAYSHGSQKGNTLKP